MDQKARCCHEMILSCTFLPFRHFEYQFQQPALCKCGCAQFVALVEGSVGQVTRLDPATSTEPALPLS
jgi:hypothetical protein